MKLNALVEDLPLAWLVPGDADVTSVVTDSREVTPGALFFAREGWFVDSHQYIPQAVRAGAVAVVVTRPDAARSVEGLPVLHSTAEDRDLGLLCDRFFGEPTTDLRVYGVTGTNGKTSVTYLLEHILSSLGERVAVIGTISHRFGATVIPAHNTTPDGLLIHGFARRAADEGATSLVIEVSSHGSELGRVAGVAFDVAGFTNLTPEHLDFHHTIDAYREAKGLLFGHFLRESANRGKQVHSVLWAADPSSDYMAELGAASGDVLFVGQGSEPGLRVAVERDLGVDGAEVSAETATAAATGIVPLVGEHNIANTAVALGMVLATHPTRLNDALAGLAGFAGIPGRFERAYDSAFGPPCFVDYAHTPDAVARAADVLASLGGGATTVVLGCGGDRDRTKRGPMAAAAVERASRVILTSDNPRSEAASAILDEMESGLGSDLPAIVSRIEDRAEAIAAAIRRADGAVLIAGKGHETTQEIGGTRYRFDDREEARRAARARAVGESFADVPLLSGWSVERVARTMGGTVVASGSRGPWGALTTDSRTVDSRGVFFALRGDRFDGHAFIEAAAGAGAGLFVVERPPEPTRRDVAVVVVPDTLAGLQRLAAALLEEARARLGGLSVLGITGSNGKTTTKEIVAALLGADALVTPGNFNNHIGLPLSVAALAPRHRYAVLEMGANRPDDIGDLVAIARPDVGLVTSVGLAHVEGFGDIDGVRRAKAQIAAQGLRALVLPAAEVKHPAWATALRSSEEAVTFGTTEDADVQAVRTVVSGPVSVSVDGVASEFVLPVPGTHNAANLAASVAAVRALTGSTPGPTPALADLALPAGRLRILDVGGRTVVDDAYNANPASMAASLGILASMSEPRVAVLGEMLELGGDAAMLHRRVGETAARAADVVVAVGAGARSIAEGAGPAARAFDDLADAAAWVAENVQPGATVLLKGSRGAGLEAALPVLRSAWEGQG